MYYLIQNRRVVMEYYTLDIQEVLNFLARDCRGTWVYQGKGQFKREGGSEEWESSYLTAVLTKAVD